VIRFQSEEFCGSFVYESKNSSECEKRRGILGGVMARQLRIDHADALHHVTSRGNEQRDIFRSNKDREAFLSFSAKR